MNIELELKRKEVVGVAGMVTHFSLLKTALSSVHPMRLYNQSPPEPRRKAHFTDRTVGAQRGQRRAESMTSEDRRLGESATQKFHLFKDNHPENQSRKGWATHSPTGLPHRSPRS